MKKWFVGMMMLLTLVLMQSTAMAATKCPTCNAYRTVKYTNDYEYLTEKMHKQIGVCSTCNTKLGGKFLNHTESLAATCTSPAYCNQCQHYYGLKNTDNHNWSEWQPNQYFPNQHYRYCLNGCGASENEPHTSNADCVTEDTCSKCNKTYKDTTKHKGPFTYAYKNYDDSFHKRIETCTACGNKTGNVVTTRHEESSPATCTAAAYCAVCKSSYGSTNPNNHVGEATTTYEKTSETQHPAMTTYSICKHTVTGSPEAHTETTAANCTTAAYCDVCKSSYGAPDPDAHDLVQYEAQAPTCFRVGWTAYEACQNEGCGYTTYEEIPRLVHWYAEWTPNADATHTASCKRGCRYQKAVSCTPITIALPTGDELMEITLCPVCGEVSDGTRLMLTEAAADGKALPAGEVVVRMGTLENGEAVLSVAFEIGGRLTRPAGQVKITLPAELLAGYTLSLLSEDGTEAELTFDAQEASFVLDFDANPSPVRVIRLVPAA